MSDFGNCTPERRKILGELNNMKAEQPISPTANLRLLTSLASNLKSATDHDNCQNDNQTDDCLTMPSVSVGLKLLPRKQKSLGLLCNKFLNLYPLDINSDIPQDISLDGTAQILGTEKRRIYDIINVLESLEMASKAGKNRYLWHGQNGLITTLTKLKFIAIKLGLQKQIREIQRISQAYFGDCEDSASNNKDFMIPFGKSADKEFNSDTTIKEDKSLGAMCQKFIMLFLVSMKHGVINLDIAAKVLITDTGNQTSYIADNASRSHFKTKVRRLYDIANVLTAIGLIKKVDMNDRVMKKPVFNYVGPNIDAIELNDDTPIREIPSSPIGMLTPNNRARTFPRAIRFNAVIDGQHATFKNDPTSTPLTDKRRPRKRKLFDTDSSLTRTPDSPILEGKSHSLERLDDSILRVAEMELERLNSSGECKPKACTKLFTRHNLDSYIAHHNHASETEKIEESDQVPPKLISSQTKLMAENLFVIDNHNDQQVKKQMNKVRGTSLITAHQSEKIGTVITPKRGYLQPVQKRIIKLLPIGNIASFNAIHPDHNVPKNLLTDNISRIARIVRYNKMEPKVKRPKIVGLANFDEKKIPIVRSDLKSLAPINRIVDQSNINTSSSNYAMLTRIHAPVVSPGDTFRAIKIGNTLQLVPIEDNNVGNSNTGYGHTENSR